MSNNDGNVKINIWINDERLAALQQAGLADLAEDAFAGMKLLVIYATDEQKNTLLKSFPGSKFDSATTKSVELLPKHAKDRLLQLAVELKSTGPEVTGKFLEEVVTA